MGAGSHLKPEIAVARAITEAAQSRVVQIQGAREDTDREGFIRSVGYDRMKRLNWFWFEEGEKFPFPKCRTCPGKALQKISM